MVFSGPVAVNREYASLSTILHDSGRTCPASSRERGFLKGAELVWRLNPRVELFEGAIPSAQFASTRLKRDPTEQWSSSDGIVRNNTRGVVRTLYLVYEGYEAMALVQMRSARG